MNRTTCRSSLFVVACLLSLTGCGSNDEEKEKEIKPRAPVQVVAVVRGPIDDLVRSTGSFQVLRDERIKATTNGKVEQVAVFEGDVVQKGQVLVSILSQESNAAIAGATQLLERAANRTDSTNAEQSLHLARRSAAFARITAPFAGAIAHRFVTEGELVSQGSDLVELVDPRSEYFAANIPLNRIASVRKGQPAIVTVPAMNMTSLQGSVEAINPATDQNSQTVQVRIALKSIPPTVAPGTFGNAAITIGHHPSALLVPVSAVYHDDELDRDIVWRIQGDSLALVAQVVTGLRDSSRVEIVSGLHAGDVVATVGGYGLPDSTDISVVSH